MRWLQLSINTTKNHLEITEDCLFTAGAQTVTLTDAADQPILEPAPNETPVWDSIVVTGLFDAKNKQQDLIDLINHCLGKIQFSYNIEILEDKNWTHAWMEHFHAMQFGKRLWICPLHIEPPEPEAINLRLDPGLAFGTGTHPTTSLCLRWLDKNIDQTSKEKNTLLDYGCGSGILAIAACMLGTNNAHGVDIDPQALTATYDNAQTNQVTNQIKTFLPDNFRKQHSTTQYDIVIANILSGPLAELAPILAKHTKKNGDIVLSGILKEQAEALIKTYNQFFKMDKPQFEDDWVLLHGVKI